MMKEYLGDSVYAELGNGELMLTTENGLGPYNVTNVIVFESQVLTALLEYLKRHKVIS